MVVGRSDIVGKPAAMLLINANATVTVCHSKTHDLPGVCRRADILVAAIGRAGMITRDFVKPGATVIDVGMNSITDSSEFQRFFAGNAKREETFRKKGSTLIGSSSRSGRSRGSPYASPGRGGPADHRDAHVQHGKGRQDAPRHPRAGAVALVSTSAEVAKAAEKARPLKSVSRCSLRSRRCSFAHF